ncbi:hypothetical protein ACTD5D_30255 [Nocardia takedensis]|uniref:hypothetical protein n=1 Tax=Nocardia takedensis TaxID=259390 RepID=UPI0002F6EF48|nr:hypothetical protein [Nocardia takedensis]
MHDPHANSRALGPDAETVALALGPSGPIEPDPGSVGRVTNATATSPAPRPGSAGRVAEAATTTPAAGAVRSWLPARLRAYARSKFATGAPRSGVPWYCAAGLAPDLAETAGPVAARLIDWKGLS